MRIRINYYLILFFSIALFASSVCHAQVSPLKGKILSDSLPTSNIHIVNLSLATGTTSDSNGNFLIRARLNDSILFSSVQFENRILVIRKNQIDTGYIEIKLFPARNELDEVRISDLNLSGRLESDSEKVKVFDPGKYGIPYPRERPSQTERRLYTANAGVQSRWAYIGVLLGGLPLDVVINDINGRTKALKHLLELDELKESVQRGIQLLDKQYFTEDLGLPESEIENFIYFCALSPRYSEIINSSNNLELIEFFASRKEEFINLRQLDVSKTE